VKSSIQRRFAVLPLLALVVAGMMASSASAATVVKDGKTKALCSNVVPALQPKTPEEEYNALYGTPAYQSGGCTVHMTGEASSPSVFHFGPWNFEMPCRVDYDIHVGPEGWGYANNFQYIVVGGLHPCRARPARDSYAVVPGDSNPFGLFTAADANTELNMYPQVEINTGVEWVLTEYGPASLDISAIGCKFAWEKCTSKATNQYVGGNQFSGGKWTGDVGLQITH
jgi:hypothetical protein